MLLYGQVSLFQGDFFKDMLNKAYVDCNVPQHKMLSYTLALTKKPNKQNKT